MIRVVNLSKAYGPNPLFDDVDFVMNPGERLGLVGRNGHGKTTLFRILTGEERPDDGSVVAPKHYRIGHLSQYLKFRESTVLGEVCSALPLSEEGTDFSYRAEAALSGLGFAPDVFQQSPEELSGGYKIRLNLAKVLVSEPNLLLLDEPTNHLDIVSVRWLKRFLRGWRGELILITHDREFMDAVTTHTMLIHRLKIRKISGTTQKIIDHVEQEEEIHEKTRLNQERHRRQQERFIERFQAKASKAKAVQSRIKALKKVETAERLSKVRDLSFRFRGAPFRAKRIIEVEGLSFHYQGRPNLIDGLKLSVGARDRIAVIGPNGRGKTTLLSLLAGALEPVAGRIQLHPGAKMAYFVQHNVERLDPQKTVEAEILSGHPDHDRGDTRRICGWMMFERDNALKKVSVLSGGEKSRVLLGKLLVSPANLLLLDEPTNHLDMQSTDGLMHSLEVFEGAVVLVTHSEMILRHVANRLIVFDGGQVRLFEGGYQDFLDKVGWTGEQTDGNAARPARTKRNRKEVRRLRAKIIVERSERLRPLERRIKELEEAILTCEREVERVDVLLCQAATRNEGDTTSELGRKSHSLRVEIDSLFSELENLTAQQNRLQPEFESRLAELE